VPEKKQQNPVVSVKPTKKEESESDSESEEENIAHKKNRKRR